MNISDILAAYKNIFCHNHIVYNEKDVLDWLRTQLEALVDSCPEFGRVDRWKEAVKK